MKKKLIFMLLIAVTSVFSSQHNNQNLHEIFDSDAFEISIPDTWKELEPAYAFHWVKQFSLKDTLSNGYFTIGQFEIKNLEGFALKNVVKTRVGNLKKARYRKFSSSIKKKESTFNNHYVLTTSWENWQDRKSTLKHTTEFVQKENIVYVFRYSDSTFSSPRFHDDVQKIMASFTIKRKAKDLLITQEIPRNQLQNYFQEYTLSIPENWYGFIDETGALQFTPNEFNQNEYTRNSNVFFVKDYSENAFYGKTLLEFAEKRYTFINSSYRKKATVRKKATHKKYGKYFLIQYSSRVMIKENNELRSTEATVIEAIIVANDRKFILTYYFENDFLNQYLEDAMEMIHSFTLRK